MSHVENGVGIKVDGYTLVLTLMHITILGMRAVEALRTLRFLAFSDPKILGTCLYLKMLNDGRGGGGAEPCL